MASPSLALNAGHHLLPEAGATQERTLEAVSSRPLFGWAGAPGALPTPPLCRDPFEQA